MSFPVSKKTMSVSSLNPSCFHLLEDLIIEILSRLPVRSLFRFTIVCKAWRALIENNPVFISKHLKQNPNLNSSRLSLSYTTIYEDPLGIYPPRHNYAMSLYSSGNTTLDMIDFPFLLDQMDSFVIIGVCNGLVCISLSMFEFNLVICNPSTRRFAKVPHFDALDAYCLENGEAAYGFAFDSSSDDYKIISLTRYTTDTKLNEKVGVYTMSTNSWREIVMDVPIDVDLWMREFNITPPALVDGVFYWGCYKYPSCNNAFVLSFNMIDESFRVISGPDGVNGVGGTNWDCVQLKEELAIFAFTGKRSFDVWTLNPDSVSWKLKYAIGTMPVVVMPTGVEDVGDITLVGSGENGDVIYEDRTSSDVQLFFYDLDSGQTKRLPYIEVCSQVVGYTESLIPVKKNEF